MYFVTIFGYSNHDSYINTWIRTHSQNRWRGGGSHLWIIASCRRMSPPQFVPLIHVGPSGALLFLDRMIVRLLGGGAHHLWGARRRQKRGIRPVAAQKGEQRRPLRAPPAGHVWQSKRWPRRRYLGGRQWHAWSRQEGGWRRVGGSRGNLRPPPPTE